MVPKEIKNLNQNLLETNMSIIPLNMLNIQGYSIVQEGNKAMFYDEDKFIKLALVKGIELDKYLVSFNVKKDIISLFEKMSVIEKTHGEKSLEVRNIKSTQPNCLYYIIN